MLIVVCLVSFPAQAKYGGETGEPNNPYQIAIGLGTRGNMTTPGGLGKMYFDDIRLYWPRFVPGA